MEKPATRPNILLTAVINLSFVSCHVERKAEVIDILIKGTREECKASFLCLICNLETAHLEYKCLSKVRERSIQPRFHWKDFYKTNNAFYLKYKAYFHELLADFKSSIKILVRPLWTLFVTWYGNKFVQYRQNYKCYNIH